MKTLANILAAFCLVFAGVQWSWIVYRIQLFYHYGGDGYANHVGEDIFAVIPCLNVALLFAAVFAAWTFWRKPVAWRWCIGCVATANVMAWLTISYMHTTGMIVGYDEFIRHWKGQS